MLRLQIRPSNSVNGHSIVYRDSSLLGIPPFICLVPPTCKIGHAQRWRLITRWTLSGIAEMRCLLRSYAARSVLERMGRSIKSFFLPESSSVNTSALYRWVDGMSVCVAPENRSCFLDKKETSIETDPILRHQCLKITLVQN